MGQRALVGAVETAVMPRYKQRFQTGPKVSGDRFDKFIAAVSWYVGRDKADPEFVRSPH
jgi:hypothetical protein